MDSLSIFSYTFATKMFYVWELKSKRYETKRSDNRISTLCGERPPDTSRYKDYQKAVGKRDRKLLALMNDGYDVMHLYMNYDGNQAKGVCDTGFRLANNIIDRCETMLS